MKEFFFPFVLGGFLSNMFTIKWLCVFLQDGLSQNAHYTAWHSYQYLHVVQKEIVGEVIKNQAAILVTDS